MKLTNRFHVCVTRNSSELSSAREVSDSSMNRTPCERLISTSFTPMSAADAASSPRGAQAGGGGGPPPDGPPEKRPRAQGRQSAPRRDQLRPGAPRAGDQLQAGLLRTRPRDHGEPPDPAERSGVRREPLASP